MALFTKLRRQLKPRLTLGGGLFLVALLLTGTGAFLSANNLLFLIFSSMLALLLVSGFLSQLVLAGLSLELVLPEHVSAKTRTEARVRLRNLKFLTPSLSIELSGRADPLTGQPPILATPAYFPLIPGRATIDAPVPVLFPRRGLHRDNLFILSTRFPFGFLLKSVRVSLRQETLVYPALDPHQNTHDLLDGLTGELDAQVRGAGLDFYRIRPWESTDSARLVDWKSTAHTGALQVREFSREDRRAVELYLDRRIAGGAAGLAWFEQAVEQCAWLAWELRDREVELTLRSQGRSILMPAEGDIYDALRYLAQVEALLTSSAGAPESPSPGDTVNLALTLFPQQFTEAGWKVSPPIPASSLQTS